MTEIRAADLGQVWLALLRAVYRTGQTVGGETRELRNVCLYEMGQRVAAALGIPMVQVAGLISSAHVYLADVPEAQGMLAEVEGSKQQAAILREGRA